MSEKTKIKKLFDIWLEEEAKFTSLVSTEINESVKDIKLYKHMVNQFVSTLPWGDQHKFQKMYEGTFGTLEHRLKQEIEIEEQNTLLVDKLKKLRNDIEEQEKILTEKEKDEKKSNE